MYEIHTNLDLDGYEDMGEDQEPTGIKLPYVITVAESNNKILSIRRNYKAEDPLKKKINYFVQFKFLPGTGFYGFGSDSHDWWINKNSYRSIKTIT